MFKLWIDRKGIVHTLSRGSLASQHKGPCERAKTPTGARERIRAHCRMCQRRVHQGDDQKRHATRCRSPARSGRNGNTAKSEGE